jgi:hypothetical protein
MGLGVFLIRDSTYGLPEKIEILENASEVQGLDS